ncbi:xylulokinase [Alicyclobacillus shizuokensis]|uniref:xylulokinase n=1 Tax=Alicyclobacillus shizuokensis TaxID=392014 RepID=UPI0008310A56|nr:FGGY family carbohydrate kinase [Alicyclobacillus shizuokensis]
MRAQEAVLTIDLGTSACKAMLFGAGLDPLYEVTVPYPRQVTPDGEACQSPDDWIRTLQQAVSRLLGEAPPAAVRMIALTSQRETVVPVGEDMRPLAPALLWLDGRGTAEADALQDAFQGRVREWTGLAPGAAYSAGKILWLRRRCPDVFSKARWYMQPKDYILYWLSGEVATDWTLAARTLLFDIHRLAWRPELLEACEVGLHQLPPVHSPQETVGRLSRAAAEQLGLSPGIPVLIGGGDRPCEVLGSGVRPREIMESSGTTSNMSCEVERIVQEECLSCTPHVLDGRWILEQGISASGAVLEWLTGLLGASTPDVQHLECVLQSVRPGSAGVLMLPWFMGRKGSSVTAGATGVIGGLTLGHQPEHLVRAALESIGYELRAVLERMRQYVEPVQAVRVVGGMAGNQAWNRMKASFYGVPVHQPRIRHAAAYGAFLLAARALGWVTEEEMRCVNPVQEEYVPDSREQEVYRAGFAAYQAFAAGMRTVWPRLDAYRQQTMRDEGAGVDGDVSKDHP